MWKLKKKAHNESWANRCLLTIDYPLFLPLLLIFCPFLFISFSSIGCGVGIKTTPLTATRQKNKTVYRITISKDRPRMLRVSLSLGTPAKKSGRIGLRDIINRGSRGNNITHVRCNRVPLDRDKEGGWRYPDGCKLLEWTVEAVNVSASG